MIRWKERILHQSWDHFAAHAGEPAREELAAFRAAPARSAWLADWTLFAALKSRFSGLPWTAWDRDLRLRDRDALERASGELEAEISYQAYLQYLFFRQWERVRAAAKERDIAILGDVPIYVGARLRRRLGPSRPVPARRGRRRPRASPGCRRTTSRRPGSCGATRSTLGRACGESGFAWWVERLRTASPLRRRAHRPLPRLRRVLVGSGRRDDAPERRVGTRARGDALRRGARRAGRRAPLPIIAEDLGGDHDDVGRLARGAGLSRDERPAVRASIDADSEHLPHRHSENVVVYTGTHDNDTARGWYASARAEERERVLTLRARTAPTIAWELIRAAYGFGRRRGDRSAPGRARPRQRGAHEHARRARRQLDLARAGLGLSS